MGGAGAQASGCCQPVAQRMPGASLRSVAGRLTCTWCSQEVQVTPSHTHMGTHTPVNMRSLTLGGPTPHSWDGVSSCPQEPAPGGRSLGPTMGTCPCAPLPPSWTVPQPRQPLTCVDRPQARAPLDAGRSAALSDRAPARAQRLVASTPADDHGGTALRPRWNTRGLTGPASRPESAWCGHMGRGGTLLPRAPLPSPIRPGWPARRPSLQTGCGRGPLWARQGLEDQWGRWDGVGGHPRAESRP